MNSYRLNSVSSNRQQQYAHYFTDGEQMLLCTTVSSYYLLNNFIKHLIYSGFLAGVVAALLLWVYKLPAWQLVTAVVLVALLYALQRWYFTKEGIQYILTDKRLIVQKGYFHISLQSANYHKITHIEVHQGWLDRLFFNHGRIVIKTAAEQRQIVLEEVHNPLEFKNLLEKLMLEEKTKYGPTSI